MKQLLLYIIIYIGASLSAFAQNRKAEMLYREADKQMLQQNYDAAYELLKRCLELDPDLAPALYNSAICELTLRHDSIALQQMERAVQLSPDNYWYKQSLVQYYFGHRMVTEAKDLLEEMEAKWQAKSEVLMMLTDAYSALGMTDSVYNCLNKIELREGKSEQMTLEKVKMLVPKQDLLTIFNELQALVQAIPSTKMPEQLLLTLLREPADAYSLLGDMYHKAGNEDRAFQYYDSCLVRRPDDAQALNNYAYYLSLRQQDLDRAEEMSRRSNELEPDNPTYLDTLAWILYHKRKYDEAKELMDRVVKLIPPEELAEDSDVPEHIKKINEAVTK